MEDEDGEEPLSVVTLAMVESVDDFSVSVVVEEEEDLVFFFFFFRRNGFLGLGIRISISFPSVACAPLLFILRCT